jgi:type I restriction enzyme R subunit
MPSGRFITEPANLKLLIVVSKLLTGFDAPSCTYIYLDNELHDHNLFQAICRTNRLDGDDKDYGLHRGLQGAVQGCAGGHRGL